MHVFRNICRGLTYRREHLISALGNAFMHVCICIYTNACVCKRMFVYVSKCICICTPTPQTLLGRATEMPPTFPPRSDFNSAGARRSSARNSSSVSQDQESSCRPWKLATGAKLRNSRNSRSRGRVGSRCTRGRAEWHVLLLGFLRAWP